MGQGPLFSLFVHFSTDISEFMKEYFRGFELTLHSPWDRAPKGSSAEEMKTAASEVTIPDDSCGISLAFITKWRLLHLNHLLPELGAVILSLIPCAATVE